MTVRVRLLVVALFGAVCDARGRSPRHSRAIVNRYAASLEPCYKPRRSLLDEAIPKAQPLKSSGKASSS